MFDEGIHNNRHQLQGHHFKRDKRPVYDAGVSRLFRKIRWAEDYSSATLSAEYRDDTTA